MLESLTTARLSLSLSFILLTTGALSSPPAAQRSYERARRTLDASIQAHGGLAALRGIRDITLRENGRHQYIHQSPGVEPPFLASPREETTVVDFDHGRLLIDLKIYDPSYYVSDSRTIINGGAGYILDKWSKEYAPLASTSLANYRNQFFQRFPHFTLLEAMERAASLRWLGAADYRGRKQEAITFVGADGRQTSLNFDARTKLLTNHSFDHMAGVRGFIAEGATVVTTPGTRRLVERLAAAPFTITQDALARQPRPPVIETIQNKRHVFRDANHLVELYDVGPGPTLSEAVLVYLPQEKLLYQSDLFNPGYVRTVIPAQLATVHFAEQLRQLGLAVEKIAAGHGDLTTPADLQTALTKRRQREAK